MRASCPQAYRRLVPVIALAVTLGACSATRIAYQNADSLLARYAEKYLDLSDPQSQQLRAQLARWLDWHRRVQLPRIRERLRALRVQFADGLDASESEALLTELRDAYRSVIAGLIPIVSDLLTSLSPDQLRQLEEAFATSNNDYRNELLTDSVETRRAKRLRWATKVAQRWVGDLNERQKRWLAQQLLRYPSMADGWLDYRMEQQQRLLTMLRRQEPRANVEVFLNEWMVKREGVSPELAAARRALFGAAPSLLLQFDAGLTPQQRAHGLQRVDSFLDLADELTLPAPG